MLLSCSHLKDRPNDMKGVHLNLRFRTVAKGLLRVMLRGKLFGSVLKCQMINFK